MIVTPGPNGSLDIQGDDTDELIEGGYAYNLVIAAYGGNDTITGSARLGTVFGGAGNDEITMNMAQGSIDSGDGNDIGNAAGHGT